MVSLSQLNQHVASYVDTGLKEAKLVLLRHSKSKLWCYFGFKEQGGDNEFVYCTLCQTKLKYCQDTTNLLSHFRSQHALEYT